MRVAELAHQSRRASASAAARRGRRPRSPSRGGGGRGSPALARTTTSRRGAPQRHRRVGEPSRAAAKMCTSQLGRVASTPASREVAAAVVGRVAAQAVHDARVGELARAAGRAPRPDCLRAQRAQRRAREAPRPTCGAGRVRGERAASLCRGRAGLRTLARSASCARGAERAVGRRRVQHGARTAAVAASPLNADAPDDGDSSHRAARRRATPPIGLRSSHARARSSSSLVGGSTRGSASTWVYMAAVELRARRLGRRCTGATAISASSSTDSDAAAESDAKPRVGDAAQLQRAPLRHRDGRGRRHRHARRAVGLHRRPGDDQRRAVGHDDVERGCSALRLRRAGPAAVGFALDGVPLDAARLALTLEQAGLRSGARSSRSSSTRPRRSPRARAPRPLRCSTSTTATSPTRWAGWRRTGSAVAGA